MTDDLGLFEHAKGTERRVEHGYCTDDNARLLVVASREADAGAARRLARVALSFTLSAQHPDGRCRNRMDRSGYWTDRAGTADSWGRSVWGFGVAAVHHLDPSVRHAARAGFDRAVQQRSPWPRAMAFSALGAADVLAAYPEHAPARALLRHAANAIGTPRSDSWMWPEPRLTYANATLAEAAIAAGAALDDTAVLDRGLAMLDWLLELETSRGHLSVTGVGGRGQADRSPQFDQQPIEAAAMADACWRAYTLTSDHRWARGVAAAAAWFDGDNDTGATMRDDCTGGGFDGLQANGVNLNQGAESTLALISTMQRASALALAPRP
jgi:hypothetical protein